MRETIEFDTVPYDEECAQVGVDGYELRACAEGRALIGQLKRTYGKELPPALSIRVKPCSHDFGSYYQVIVAFDVNDTEAQEAAYWFDSNFPSKWDTAAKDELLGRA